MTSATTSATVAEVKDFTWHPLPAGQRVSVDDAAEIRRHYLQHMARTLAPTTAHDYSKRLGYFERFTGRDLVSTTADDVDRFLREADYTQGSKALTVTTLAHFNHWLLREWLRAQSSDGAPITIPAHTKVHEPVRNAIGQFAPGNYLGTRIDPHPDDEAFWRYLVGRRGVQETTAYDYLRSVRRLERWTGQPRRVIDMESLERFMMSTKWSWQTRNLTLLSFRHYHRWGAGKGRWDYNLEFDEIRLRKKRVIIKPSLTLAQAVMLLNVAQTPMEQRFVFLGLYQGLRISEIVAVDERAWVPDQDGGVLRLVVKGGNEREIPVHPELAARRDYILSVPTDIKALRRAVYRLRRFVAEGDNEPAMTPHWLRRTFGRTLSGLGVERDVIGALLGHATSSVTVTHYVQVRNDEMRDALNRLHYSTTHQLNLFTHGGE